MEDRVGAPKRYCVSTARTGPGEMRGSYCTPRGRHIVRAKIGRDAPINTVFTGCPAPILARTIWRPRGVQKLPFFSPGPFFAVETE